VRKLLSRVIAGVVVGVAVYVAFSVWADAGRVAEALSGFHWHAAVLGLGLAAANYLLRFVRWQYYLRVLSLRVPLGESLLVFLSGFALTVTPGKLGEAIKAILLRQSRGIPAARTAPIVIAERVTDLIALLILATLGAFTFQIDRRFLVVGAVVTGAGILAITFEPIARPLRHLAGRVPGLRRFASRLEEFHRSAATLLALGPLLVAVFLAVASWALECVAFWEVVRGFPDAHVGLLAATCIYALMTVVGALSFLPGGLGVTEAGMLTLLVRYGTGTDRAVAAASTFVTRAVTLWFAVLVGLVALIIFLRRSHLSPTLQPSDTTS
jgi:glycosyltransferase 2 family protein